MRVLHVIPAVARRYGGPSVAVVPMCEALMKAGVETLIVTTNADGDGRLNVPVNQPTAWHGVPALFFNRDFSESLKYSSKLASWLRRSVSAFDVVHIHAVLSHSCLSAASACRAQQIPYVIRPLGTLAPWSLQQKALRKRVALALGARRAILAAGAIHCTSDEERRGIERTFPGANAAVIPLGIDAAVFDASEVSGADRYQDPYVLALSRLHPKKNLEALIKAFASAASRRREPWRLVIAGTGETSYVERLQQFVKEHDQSGRISLVGWVEGAIKHELLRRASLFALTSFHENFGVSVLEALAAKVPVIVSCEVDLADAVQRSAAGWVVAPTVEAIDRGLSEAFGDPSERSARARAARALAKRFAWPEIAAELVDLYRRLQPDSASLGDSFFSSTAVAER